MTTFDLCSTWNLKLGFSKWTHFVEHCQFFYLRHSETLSRDSIFQKIFFMSRIKFFETVNVFTPKFRRTFPKLCYYIVVDPLCRRLPSAFFQIKPVDLQMLPQPLFSERKPEKMLRPLIYLKFRASRCLVYSSCGFTSSSIWVMTKI